MKTTVTPEAKIFYNRAEATFLNLYERWQDEKGYEDLQDYRKPLEQIAKKCKVKLHNMTARPFGVYFLVGEREFHLYKKGNFYSYQRKA